AALPAAWVPAVFPVGTTLTARTVKEKFPTGGADGGGVDPVAFGVPLSLDPSRTNRPAAMPSTTTAMVPYRIQTRRDDDLGEGSGVGKTGEGYRGVPGTSTTRVACLAA